MREARRRLAWGTALCALAASVALLLVHGDRGSDADAATRLAITPDATATANLRAAAGIDVADEKPRTGVHAASSHESVRRPATLTGGLVHGVVLAPGGGPAGAGVTVVALIGGENYSRVREPAPRWVWSATRTDAHGRFTIAGLDLGSGYVLSAAGMGVISGCVVVDPVRAASDEPPIELPTNGLVGLRWGPLDSPAPGEERTRFRLEFADAFLPPVAYFDSDVDSPAVQVLPAYAELGAARGRAVLRSIVPGSAPHRVRVTLDADGDAPATHEMLLQPVVDHLPFDASHGALPGASLAEVAVEFLAPMSWRDVHPESALGRLEVRRGQRTSTILVEFGDLCGRTLECVPLGATAEFVAMSGVRVAPSGGPVAGLHGHTWTFDLEGHAWVRVEPSPLFASTRVVTLAATSADGALFRGRPRYGDAVVTARFERPEYILPLLPEGTWRIVAIAGHRRVVATSEPFRTGSGGGYTVRLEPPVPDGKDR